MSQDMPALSVCRPPVFLLWDRLSSLSYMDDYDRLSSLSYVPETSKSLWRKILK